MVSGGSADLSPTDQTLLDECKSAADELGFAVPCPTALPPLTAPARCARSFADISPNEPCVHGRGFVLLPTVSTDSGLFHLVIEASDTPNPDCGVDDSHEKIDIGGYSGFLIECSELAGVLAGHSLVRWNVDDITIDVSLHGHSEQDQIAAVSIAEAVDLVAPS